ncbi:hypothetical protein [Sunxiuqinia indica]|uniref:hypothetical protein n=1 Tax=Sunxiuqinia indica TaxID=2692584 RepID=UPI00135AF7CE|nr:hypothetical protein [Sunxiuqinia indica]
MFLNGGLKSADKIVGFKDLSILLMLNRRNFIKIVPVLGAGTLMRTSLSAGEKSKQKVESVNHRGIQD